MNTKKTIYIYKVQTSKGLKPYSNTYDTKEEAERWLVRYREKMGYTMQGEFILVEQKINYIKFS